MVRVKALRPAQSQIRGIRQRPSTCVFGANLGDNNPIIRRSRAEGGSTEGDRYKIGHSPLLERKNLDSRGWYVPVKVRRKLVSKGESVTVEERAQVDVQVDLVPADSKK
jgi:hypothetical protein